MTCVVEPAVSFLAFFDATDPPKRLESLSAPWLAHPALSAATKERGQVPGIRYRAETGDGISLLLECSAAQATRMLRLTLTHAGQQDGWSGLTPLLSDCIRLAWSKLQYPEPWAATVFHLGLLPERAGLAEAQSLMHDPPGPKLAAGKEGVLSLTPYGWVGTCTGQGLHLEGRLPRPRCLVLLMPERCVQQAMGRLIAPINGGWVSIERHLHEALHCARTYAPPDPPDDGAAGAPSATAKRPLSLRLDESHAALRSVLADLEDDNPWSANRLADAALTMAAALDEADALASRMGTSLARLRAALDRLQFDSPVYQAEVGRLDALHAQLAAHAEKIRAEQRAGFSSGGAPSGVPRSPVATPEASGGRGASQQPGAGTGAPGTHVQKPSTRQQDRAGYDVFISYRREWDAPTARLIRAELQQRGYRVFLDVDDLPPGHFDEALESRIKESSHFVVILSPRSLKRCGSPGDWLRREIVCALANSKVIIPLLMPGFKWPADSLLPEELQPLPRHQGVEWSHGYFDAMVVKLVGYLGSPQAG